MTGGISRRVLLGGITSLAAGQVWAGAPLTSPLPVRRPGNVSKAAARPADTLIAKAELGGKIGYVVADGHTGAVLETKNPLLALPPASVAKAATAAYGLEALGAGYQFRTRLVATGPVEGGVLKGDLVLVGGGDPVMDTIHLADMARQLKATGVTGITGKFKVYAGALPYLRQIDKEQPDHLGYNPAVSGVNLNFNRVYFQWKRATSGYTVTMDARSDRYQPRVATSQMRVVERDMPVYTYKQDGDVDEWTVARGALGDAGSRWLPVRRPDLYAAEVFQSLARSFGIVLPVAKEVSKMPGGTVLVEHKSASLKAITQLMLKYSNNMTAEVVGLTASTARGRDPNSLRASARMMNDWMKDSLGTRHAKLVDHSGLSDASRLSASDMVKALVHAGAGGQLHGLMKEVVPVDRNGRQDPDAGYSIHAKTGTLNFVSSLAGYMTTPSGRPLVFAIFTAEMKRRGEIKRSDRERPAGARGWSGRSRWLQHQLLGRWASLYDS